MKKLLSTIISIAVILTVLSGCGSEALTGHEGKYISIAGKMLGIPLSAEEISGWDIDLSAGGKGTMDIDGKNVSIKWSVDDGIITIKTQGEEMTGKIDGDVIAIDDVLGMGMKLTFAKEGSQAASDPYFVLSEDEKSVVGTWKSNYVSDVSDNDASEEIDPAAFTMELLPDKTAKITYKGSDMGDDLTWSWYTSLGGSIQGCDVTWTMNEDGSIKVTYYEGDDFYYFNCVK